MLKNFPAFLLFIIITPCLFSQKLPVKTYTTKDGLISSYITALKQDSKGYLWIGSDEGVSIFDGVRFKNYTINSGNKVLGQINAIEESALVPGTMWIASNGAGLIKYSEGEFSFNSLGNNVLANRINSVVENNDGSVWCATDDGIYLFKDSTAKKIPYKNLTEYPTLTKDKAGVIWYLDENIFSLFSSKDGKLLSIANPKIPTDSILRINVLPDSSVAIITRSSHVYIVKNFSIVQEFDVPIPIVAIILQDQQNNFWMVTSGGLFYQTQSGAEDAKRLYTTTNGLPVNDFSVGMRDRENNLWFGSYGRGLTKLEVQQSVQFTFAGMSGKGTVDRFEHIWIPSSHGIFEVWQDSIKRWRRKLHLLYIAEKNISVNDVAVDSSNNLWIADSKNTLHYVATKRQQGKESALAILHSLFESKGFPKILSVTMLVDSRNILWAGLLSGGIVAIENNPHPSIVAKFIYPQETLLRDVRAMYEDRQHNLWFLGYEPDIQVLRYEKGKYIFDSTNSALHLLPNGLYRSVLQTSDGAMWFGSRYEGLYKISGNTVQHYTTKDGLISNQIWNLAETQDANILLGTQTGVMRFAEDTSENIISYQKYSESPVYSLHTLGKNIYSVTRYDLTIFSLSPLEEKTISMPPVEIVSLLVNGKERPLNGLYNFSPTENTITVDYTAIQFNNTENIHFQYKLEPIETKWREATKNRSVTYAGLSSGNYTFVVRTTDAKGKLISSQRNMPFTIATPLWLRWWMIVLYGIVLISLLYGAEKIRVQRLLEIEKIRSRIAADLHDDIGSGLTRIALISDVIQKQMGQIPTVENSQHNILTMTRKAGMIARELVDGMSDVVWSIDPKNNSMEKLIFRLRAFATEMCDAKEIIFTLSTGSFLGKLKPDSQILRSILLIAKEAVTNAVRHSKATELLLNLSADKKYLYLKVQDNGKGFHIETLTRMNGLTNMRIRAEKAGGTFTILSEVGKGATINATIPHL